MDTLVSHNQFLPGFRFVDIYRAAKNEVEKRDNVKHIASQQHETLEALLHPSAYGDRTAARAASKAFAVSPTEEESIATDTFWVSARTKDAAALVIRVRYIEYSEQCELSIAGKNAKAIFDRIIERSSKTSIFRNHTITLGYEAGKKDEYGDVEKPEKLSVSFSSLPKVGDDEIILDERLLHLLERNMIDLDQRREVLRKNGVAARRGLLLHGPPGTGKTYACRYLEHRMPNTTRIFLTGTALANVTAVFSLARLLQPAVVFIEDADLMFSAREINLYSSSLGELMDQLDGLRANEEISLVMTTNAIERLESALKDRPGRISQCIYLGEPGPDLRERFLKRLLNSRDVSDLDFDALVRLSDGTTQAFLKEWVMRSIQISCERIEGDEPAHLTNADFREAMEEMRSNREDAAGKIVGFLTPRAT